MRPFFSFSLSFLSHTFLIKGLWGKVETAGSEWIGRIKWAGGLDAVSWVCGVWLIARDDTNKGCPLSLSYFVFRIFDLFFIILKAKRKGRSDQSEYTLKGVCIQKKS